MRRRARPDPAQQPFWTAHQGDLMVVCAMGSGGFAKVPDGLVGVFARRGGHDGPADAEYRFVIAAERYEELYRDFRARMKAHLEVHPQDHYGFLLTDEFKPATEAFHPADTEDVA